MAFYTTTGKEATSNFSLVPKGDYSALIIKSEMAISKTSGKNMIKLELDTGKGHLWYYLTEGAEDLGRKIRSILESANAYKPGMDVDPATFRGLRCKIKVDIKMKNGESRNEVYFNKPEPGDAAPTPASDKRVNPEEVPF